ncbi:MAG TPA: hypothetical protein RMH99_02410 [Sandaracinaceae bacterium LLY-WYZ-13_1]|nr:hypothetical protein [Sandaracinaceae bacterium LLY-WYZ-13_1]
MADTLHPLRVRPGARFTCHGDGLCCTDVHAFGPLSDDEAAMLRAIDPAVVDDHHGERVVTLGAEGRCIFRRHGRCELHASLGPDVKPASCQQFPFVFVATPAGGRVATEHRCPCRTLGERAELTAEAAVAEAGRPETPDRRITDTLPRTADERVTLAEWEAIEAPMLARLAAGDDPLDVLGAPPLDPPDRWRRHGASLLDEGGRTRFSAAVRRFGAALLRLGGAEVTGVDERLGWDDVFDRAERRSPTPTDPAAQLNDWLADALWSLEWAFRGPFDEARRELATRVGVARRIAADLEAEGRRPDRAMAEAIAVIELAALADR